MIKLTRGAKPQILIDNEQKWLDAIEEAILECGTFEQIPKEERKNLQKHYNQPEVQTSLFASSNNKCAYCECNPTDGAYLTIEHFLPKSIHYEKTFDWDNFLPCCPKCNSKKNDVDTKIDEIINPYDEDPKNQITFESCLMVSKDGPSKDKAYNTIQTCDLNRSPLIRARANLLVSLNNLVGTLENLMEDVKQADTDRKRENRIKKVKNSLECLDEFAQCDQIYSAFCRHFIDNSSQIRAAKSFVAAEKARAGLS